MDMVKVLSNPLDSASGVDYSWSFTLNMVPQYEGARPWRDYLYGEGSYIILSFVAKAILSWIVFVGIFTPGSQFLSLKPPKKKERDYC